MKIAKLLRTPFYGKPLEAASGNTSETFIYKILHGYTYTENL